jgi:hypothetical protein
MLVPHPYPNSTADGPFKRSLSGAVRSALKYGCGQVYNGAVTAPIHPGSARRIYGLILIALLILLITIARFWQQIPWSAR